MAKETGPLSGFRDMLADQMIPRQQMIETIKGVYESYGFTPLDTPAIERRETLTGKYGPEGEKLMYKLTDHGGRELALRYDLTVPLARVVAQHRGELPLPYKRYQVGNVWRGESPQAGRYREFMQFDADTVGTRSVISDIEVVAMMSDTMRALGVDAVVKVNNRRILDGLAEEAGVVGGVQSRVLIGTIDKIEKIGRVSVLEEISNSLGEQATAIADAYLEVGGSSLEKIQGIEALMPKNIAVQEGVENISQVFRALREAGYSEAQVVFDPTIARGLEYYTGIIYETTLKELPRLGSICSGGRFDNLVAALGGPDLPAVGTSVGVDRLFAGLQSLGLIRSVKTTSQVLIANFDTKNVGQYISLASGLRRAGVAAEVYYEDSKLGKQFGFADRMGINYVVLLGSVEIEEGVVKVKELSSGEQIKVKLDQLSSYIKEKLQGKGDSR